MRRLQSRVTAKGQVTIPVEIRRLLGVQAHDRVEFQIENGHVRLTPAESWVARTKGMLKGFEPPLTAEELRRAAEEAWVEDAMERLEQSGSSPR